MAIAMMDVTRLMQPGSLPAMQDGESAAAAATCLGDRQVVAAIWAQIELLLCGGGSGAAAIRQLTAALPVLDLLPTQDLPALAHLHLSSAGHLMSTIKMLVPAAFNNSAEPDVAALAAVTGSTADAVNVLIELQLLHLSRARDITSQMRARITLRREMAQKQMQGCVSCSSGSSCDDDSLVQSFD